MRLISFPLAVCCMVVFGCGRNSVPPAIPTDSVIEKKIDSLIRKMTLEEKIGQMTEITVGVVTDKSGISLSEEMLDREIQGGFNSEHTFRGRTAERSFRRRGTAYTGEIS